MLKIIKIKNDIHKSDLILNKYKIKCISDSDFYVGNESFTCRFLYFKNDNLYAFINILNNSAGFYLKDLLESKDLSIIFSTIVKADNKKIYIDEIHAILINVDIC